MAELRGGASNRLRAVAIAQLLLLATISTGYYLPQTQGFIGFAVKKTKQWRGEKRQ